MKKFSKTEIHKSWAHGVIQKFEQNGRQVIYGRRNNGSHTCKRTPELEKVISDIYAENNRTTNKIMLNSIENQCGEVISERTLQRSKKEQGFIGILQKVIHDISSSNLERRFIYCTDHFKDKFTNCLFTDESSVQIFENKTLVWWQPGYEERPIVKLKPIHDKIMVWGGISREKRQNW